MRIKGIGHKELERYRPSFVQFIGKTGNGRITHHAIRWFQKISNLETGDGMLIAASLDKSKLIGLIVFGNYGIDESFITVHPEYRSLGIGDGLLKYSLQHLKKVYTRVACDNIASLKLCSNCGLVAFRMFKGPTGKPTLWLAGGEWDKDDISSEPQQDNPLSSI